MISWTRHYNANYGRSISKADIKQWAFWKDLSIKKEEADIIFEMAWKDWQNLPTTEDDLSEKTRQLNEFGEVDVVTAVHESHNAFVKQWLESKGILYSKIVYPKASKCTLDYSLFIDDSPTDALNAAHNKKMYFLYNQEWNRHVSAEGVVRITNLSHGISLLKQNKIVIGKS